MILSPSPSPSPVEALNTDELSSWEFGVIVIVLFILGFPYSCWKARAKEERHFDTLPVVRNSNENPSSRRNACVVCLKKSEDGEPWHLFFPMCKHECHAQCFNAWSRREELVCPICCAYEKQVVHATHGFLLV